MKILKSEFKQCPYCMEKHDVQIVEVEEKCTFKGELIEFIATYEYCSNSKEYWETEEMLSANDIALKDAYKTKVGLLTSSEIRAIREKYGMSQNDFSNILGFGGKTITRYENHYVQEKTHDNMIKRVCDDYKFLLELLDIRMTNGDVPARYAKYRQKIKEFMEEDEYTYEFVSSCDFTRKIDSDCALQETKMPQYDDNVAIIQEDGNVAA